MYNKPHDKKENVSLSVVKVLFFNRLYINNSYIFVINITGTCLFCYVTIVSGYLTENVVLFDRIKIFPSFEYFE